MTRKHMEMLSDLQDGRVQLPQKKT